MKHKKASGKVMGVLVGLIIALLLGALLSGIIPSITRIKSALCLRIGGCNLGGDGMEEPEKVDKSEEAIKEFQNFISYYKSCVKKKGTVYFDFDREGQFPSSLHREGFKEQPCYCGDFTTNLPEGYNIKRKVGEVSLYKGEELINTEKMRLYSLRTSPFVWLLDEDFEISNNEVVYYAKYNELISVSKEKLTLKECADVNDKKKLTEHVKENFIDILKFSALDNFKPLETYPRICYVSRFSYKGEDIDDLVITNKDIPEIDFCYFVLRGERELAFRYTAYSYDIDHLRDVNAVKLSDNNQISQALIDDALLYSARKELTLFRFKDMKWDKENNLYRYDKVCFDPTYSSQRYVFIHSTPGSPGSDVKPCELNIQNKATNIFSRIKETVEKCRASTSTNCECVDNNNKALEFNEVDENFKIRVVPEKSYKAIILWLFFNNQLVGETYASSEIFVGERTEDFVYLDIGSPNNIKLNKAGNKLAFSDKIYTTKCT